MQVCKWDKRTVALSCDLLSLPPEDPLHQMYFFPLLHILPSFSISLNRVLKYQTVNINCSVRQ